MSTSNLNSVIVEGVVVGVTKYTDLMHITLLSHRYYRQYDDVLREDNYFQVVVYGKKYVECCSKLVELDKSIRVVGRLHSLQYIGSSGSSVEIVAEHIEATPDKKEPEDDGDWEVREEPPL